MLWEEQEITAKGADGDHVHAEFQEQMRAATEGGPAADGEDMLFKPDV